MEEKPNGTLTNGGAAAASTRSAVAEDELTVFEGKPSPLYHRLIALSLWLGAIHFLVILVITATFFLPATSAFAVFGLLIVLMAIPLNDQSKLGLKLSRYICRHVCGYFPVKLHVEDIKAFHPNQAYG
ncbi:hypothetical protein GIB67_030037 [Kingdonia uniflora]|uniref:Uncharacterized protein n=1 Tax=Kingdonia uniflora TaxID=39325 RepID=A0A7J7MXV4_9MAGN|nr:hypothetical protein GIB67_030037 [Kingdonia uniflora]